MLQANDKNTLDLHEEFAPELTARLLSGETDAHKQLFEDVVAKLGKNNYVSG